LKKKKEGHVMHIHVAMGGVICWLEMLTKEHNKRRKYIGLSFAWGNSSFGENCEKDAHNTSIFLIEL
jgi:hypothetical protein